MTNILILPLKLIGHGGTTGEKTSIKAASLGELMC